MYSAFLDMQNLRIGLILVLEGVLYSHYIWLKYFLGKVPLHSDILF